MGKGVRDGNVERSEGDEEKGWRGPVRKRTWRREEKGLYIVYDG